jgi:hypothetical protein
MVGFKLGNFVRLQGLSTAAYNGKLACVESGRADESTGEFLVELQADDEVAFASHLSRKILVKPENMARACDCCRLAGAATMQYCGRCRNAAYCNAECQRNDWKRHKVDCSTMNSQRQLVKSPLLFAVTVGNLAEVENLIRAGADVNTAAKEDGMTALFVAAQMGHFAIVQYLVQQGADKDKTDRRGVTPLFIAALSGHLEIVQYLVRQGADVNQAPDGGMTTPLAIATSEGHSAVANYLREQGGV